MKVFGFPGQGAQAKGMGSDLFADFPEVVDSADSILGYSIVELCLGHGPGELVDTRYAQPALFTVEVLALLRHQDTNAVPPDFVIGHSLGEFTALFAAGVFDFPTGLRLVQRRGELMAAAPAGAMAAMLGPTRSEVAEFLQACGEAEIDVALDNAPGQIALSGPVAAIDRVVAAAEAAELKCVRLNTSGPFHSRLMRGAAEAFAEHLARVPLADPKIPVVANATGRPHAPGRIAENLARQLTETVRWRDSVEHVLAAGDGELEFVELGPGRTLTGMVSRIRAAAATPLPH